MREIACRIAIAGENSCAIAVFVVHRHANGLVICLGADHRQDGAEYFLPVDVHLGRDMIEEMRADEKAILVALQFEIAPVDDQFRALVHAALHQPQNVVFGRRGHDGAVIHVIARGPRPDLQRLDFRDKAFAQRVRRTLTHGHGHRNCHAAFARSTKPRHIIARRRVGHIWHQT